MKHHFQTYLLSNSNCRQDYGFSQGIRADTLGSSSLDTKFVLVIRQLHRTASAVYPTWKTAPGVSDFPLLVTLCVNDAPC